MLKWLRRPNEKTADEDPTPLAEEDVELEVIDVRRTEDAEHDAVMGMIEAPVLESLIRTGADVHVVMSSPDAVYKFAEPTTALHVLFRSSDQGQSKQLALAGRTPRRVNRLINTVKDVYGHWIAVRHSYRVMRKKRCLEMRVQCKERAAVYFVSYIAGVTKTPLRNVPVLFCQRGKGSRAFDVQVLVGNIPMCEGCTVTTQFSREVNTDLHGATEMQVLCEAGRRVMTERGFVSEAEAQRPDDGIERVNLSEHQDMRLSSGRIAPGEASFDEEDSEFLY